MSEWLIISIVCLFIVALNLSLIAHAKKTQQRWQRARIKTIDKNRPLFEKRRNINKGWDDYNYKDDYYRK